MLLVFFCLLDIIKFIKRLQSGRGFIMKTKLIAIDIDATLINDQKEIMPQTKHELKKLSNEGFKIVLCSGRAITGLEPYLKELDLWGRKNQYAIAFNGGNVYSLEKLNSVAANYLTDEETIQLDQLARQLNVNGEVVTSKSNAYVVNGDMSVYADVDRKDSRLNFYQVSGYEFLENENVQKYLWTDHPDVISKKIEEIPAEYFDRYQIVRSGSIFLEFLPKNVSKGNAVQALAQKLKIDLEDVIAFGDEENDLSMFNVAGTAVAMKNARDEIKKATNMISLDDNNHDGIGKTLVKMFG